MSAFLCTLSFFTVHSEQKVNDSVNQLLQGCPILPSAATFCWNMFFPGDVSLALKSTLFWKSWHIHNGGTTSVIGIMFFLLNWSNYQIVRCIAVWRTSYETDFYIKNFVGQTNKKEEVELQVGLQVGLLDQKLSYWLRISLFEYCRHLPEAKGPSRDKKKYYCTPAFVITQFLLAVLHIRLFTWFEHELVCLLCKHRSMVLISVQIPYYPWENGEWWMEKKVGDAMRTSTRRVYCIT